MATLSVPMLLTGCVDNDYDFDHIDATMGLGGDTLWLPSNNSSNEIQLDDILDLDTTGAVKILPNGDYAIDFTEEGNHASSVSIPQLTMSAQNYSGAIYIDLPAGAKRRGVARASINMDEDICDLNYDFQNVPADIVDLDYASINSAFRFSLQFPQGMSSWVSRIDEIRITLPAYLDLASVAGAPASLSGNIVTLTNVNPANNVTLTIQPKGINIADNAFNKQTRRLHTTGKVKVGMTISSGNIQAASVPADRNRRAVTGRITMGAVAVNSVTGRFSPVYDFTNLGDVRLDDMPDFLTDHEVVADLYNPQVNLTTYNKLPVDILVHATLQPHDANGRDMGAIPIQTFRLPAGKTSVVSLRRQEGTAGPDTTVVKVNGMERLLRHIPNNISIPVIHAVADSTKRATVELGNEYTYDAWTKTHLETPLSFADSARIVYSDTLDGWNSSIKHFRFMERVENGQTVVDGRLRVECDVENRVPAYLYLEANGVDVDGNEIPADRLRVVVAVNIDPSTDGVTPKSTHETIILQPLDNDVFKQLDGLRLRFTASSYAEGESPIQGLRLNAYKQTLRLTNFRAVKEGKLVGDFN